MNFKPQRMLTTSIGALALSAGIAQADIVQLDDVIIEFSLCVGNDCVNGESFGFDTIRMKENNLRLHFLDTSNSASFPQNDWRIIANDSSNGGSNYLAIEDSTAGRIPFRVEAGASANALVVEADSDVGIGLLDPVVELHVRDGDSPTLRLEQDGSSGFTPQTFDLVSNEANFFIRDVTNGSQLPFRIKPGADSDSLFIAANNNIGVGTDNPTGALHIRKTGNNNADLVLEQTGTTDARWIIRNNEATGRMTYRNDTTGLTPFKMGNDAVENLLRVGIDANNIVDINGALDVSGAITSASITTSGSCSVGCDAVFEADYDLPTIAEHTEAMYSLGYLPNVGPTFEGQRIDVADKLGRVLNELEHAHIYIAELNQRIVTLEEQLAEK